MRVDLADAGVRLLVTTMYRGQRERIVPPAVAGVAFGERRNTQATYYKFGGHVRQVCHGYSTSKRPETARCSHSALDGSFGRGFGGSAV